MNEDENWDSMNFQGSRESMKSDFMKSEITHNSECVEFNYFKSGSLDRPNWWLTTMNND